MTIYAEQILLDNFLVDGAMLYAVTRILNVVSKGGRIALAALAGSLAALAGALFGGWVMTALRVLCAPAMVLAAGRRYTPRKYGLCLGLFLMLTACCGGACYFVLDNFGPAAAARLPVGLIALGVTLACVAGGRLLCRVRNAKQRREFVYRVEIEYRGRRAATDAYLDSGNLLRDPATGFPVIVFDASVLTPLFGAGVETEIALGRTPRGAEGRTIAYGTAAGAGRLFIFRPDRIRIYSDKSENILYNVMAGAALLAPIAECKALFGPGVLAEVRV